jgi:hypothetical protein
MPIFNGWVPNLTENVAYNYNRKVYQKARGEGASNSLTAYRQRVIITTRFHDGK